MFSAFIITMPTLNNFRLKSSTTHAIKAWRDPTCVIYTSSMRVTTETFCINQIPYLLDFVFYNNPMSIL